jgi:hypothetical protein
MNIDPHSVLLWSVVAFSVCAVIGPAIFVVLHSHHAEKETKGTSE